MKIMVSYSRLKSKNLKDLKCPEHVLWRRPRQSTSCVVQCVRLTWRRPVLGMRGVVLMRAGRQGRRSLSDTAGCCRWDIAPRSVQHNPQASGPLTQGVNTRLCEMRHLLVRNPPGDRSTRTLWGSQPSLGVHCAMVTRTQIHIAERVWIKGGQLCNWKGYCTLTQLWECIF